MGFLPLTVPRPGTSDRPKELASQLPAGPRTRSTTPHQTSPACGPPGSASRRGRGPGGRHPARGRARRCRGRGRPRTSSPSPGQPLPPRRRPPPPSHRRLAAQGCVAPSTVPSRSVRRPAFRRGPACLGGGPVRAPCTAPSWCPKSGGGLPEPSRSRNGKVTGRLGQRPHHPGAGGRRLQATTYQVTSLHHGERPGATAIGLDQERQPGNGGRPPSAGSTTTHRRPDRRPVPAPAAPATTSSAALSPGAKAQDGGSPRPHRRDQQNKPGRPPRPPAFAVNTTRSVKLAART